MSDDCFRGVHDPDRDGPDLDEDGLCDAGDDDDDGDGVPDADDNDPQDNTVCRDVDGDGADDCVNGQDDPVNDGNAPCDTGALPACRNPVGLSCADVLRNDPFAIDGVYCLDPDGDGEIEPLILIDDPAAPNAGYCIDADVDGPLGPVRVYRDMTTDGGGWALVYRGVTSDRLGFHRATGEVRVPLTPMPDRDRAFKYSDAVITQLSSGGMYRFARDDGAPRYAAALPTYDNNARQPVRHCGDLDLTEGCFAACVHHYNYYGLIMSGPGCRNSGVSGWASDFIALNTYASAPWYSHQSDGSYASFNWWVRSGDGSGCEDIDGDGLCDFFDTDRDGDGVNNDVDSNADDGTICDDADADGCDDCSSGVVDPGDDGADFDGDGVCDAGDGDDDGDGVADADDSDPLDAFTCRDADADACDDCANGRANPADDGADFDGDGQCDFGDGDDDNDGVPDDLDAEPRNGAVCGDSDNDGCDDCDGRQRGR